MPSIEAWLTGPGGGAAISTNRRTISSLESRVRKFILDHNLAHAPHPLVIGVSGGPDSLSLLYALHRLSPKLGLLLHVAHFNHALRGPASDSDADFVKAQSESLGLPFSTAKEYVKSLPAGHSQSLEEKAREARYNFLAQVAAEQDALGIAVAHTADDQAETVLLHLIRGTGLRGLVGMKPVSEAASVSGHPFTLFRPLLDITRAQTEAYCQALDLEPRLDHTNLLPDTLRNRVRLELLPQLRQYNPRISDSFIRLAESASLDLSFIQSQVDEISANLLERGESGLCISRRKLSEIHLALRRRVLSKALESMSGSPIDIEAVHVEAIDSLLTADTGAKLDLPKGILATLDYNALILTSLRAIHPHPPLPEVGHPIKVPGRTLLPGWKITAVVEDSPSTVPDPDPYSALFDMDRLPGPLIIRRRQPGDRFTPLGMSGSKKLQDFLTDTKVPRHLRDSIPIVLSGDQIIWVVGHRPSDHTKLNPTTQRTLRLTFERSNPKASET